MAQKGESESWLVWSLRDAREKVAAWRDWEKRAMRVEEPASAPKAERARAAEGEEAPGTGDREA